MTDECKWCGSPHDCDCNDRIHCEDKGKPGHFGCGWCEHNKPVFVCSKCFMKGAAGYPVNYVEKRDD